MYRAVTLFAMRNGFIVEGLVNVDALVASLAKIHLTFKFNDQLGHAEIYLNGENVAEEIRSMQVSQYVSPVAEIEAVRQKLVAMQQGMGHQKGIVMDGRDIGTVVFPEAELKIFMTASPDKRAFRRYKELLDNGQQVTFAEVLKNVENRDFIDSHREFSPLRQAEDAIVFDNSDMGLEEQFERLYGFAQRLITA